MFIFPLLIFSYILPPNNTKQTFIISHDSVSQKFKQGLPGHLFCALMSVGVTQLFAR